ncbi:hypothetical protein [Candidatus Nitrosocosmicus oleophilus]|uniref:hypothetical protein n=1 Tax=Candidatus Nitrosocosmicus oleophilus TaxID=1353260 RepID=UPI0018C9AECA|nr:hypothetical protein [Candidatus Nitrosocosmicus oleophilus]
MTIKRLSLTSFFIILTLSTGLFSVNLPITANAQNNALSQRGGVGTLTSKPNNLKRLNRTVRLVLEEIQ